MMDGQTKPIWQVKFLQIIVFMNITSGWGALYIYRHVNEAYSQLMKHTAIACIVLNDAQVSKRALQLFTQLVTYVTLLYFLLC